MYVRVYILLLCVCLLSCGRSAEEGQRSVKATQAYLVSQGCYEDDVAVNAMQALANEFIQEVTSLRPYCPDSLCDYPFFELYNLHNLPYCDTTIFTRNMHDFTNNHYAKCFLYGMIKQVKLRYEKKWYVNNDLMTLGEFSISSWTDPITNLSMPDAYIFLSDSIHWCHYTVERNEKITLNLSDGQPIAFSEPLKWSLSCDYCQLPVCVEYPSFMLAVDRVAVVSSLILVRNFSMCMPAYDVKDNALSISADSIHTSAGIYVLGKTYKFVPLR